MTREEWLILFDRTGRTARPSGDRYVAFSCLNGRGHPNSDQHPSAWVDPDHDIAGCFGCGARWSGETLRILLGAPAHAGKASVPVVLPKPPYKPNRLPGPLTDLHRHWLQQRHIANTLTIQLSRIGSDPDRGLGIPWCGQGRDRQKVRWVNWRPLRPDKPKYLAEKGSPKRESLYGWHLFPENSGDFVTLVEGELDAIALHQASLFTLALGGTHVSQAQISQLVNWRHHLYGLQRPTYIVWFDADEAGQAATPVVVNALHHAGLKAMALPFTPSGNSPKDDPADWETLDVWMRGQAATSFGETSQC